MFKQVFKDSDKILLKEYYGPVSNAESPPNLFIPYVSLSSLFKIKEPLMIIYFIIKDPI